MKPTVLFLATALTLTAAQPPAEWIAAGEKRRAEIPLGGDLKPNPKAPVFVAVGHGARILLSRDDGRTWRQVFFGYPGSDHGMWATKSVAYADGVFVVPVGWGAPTAYLASEDGRRWRHLTDGSTRFQLKEAKGDPGVMPGAWSITGGDGTFVASGYMTMTATPDLGRTFTTFSLRAFKDDPRPRKLVTHHVGSVYCGDATRRFLALGNDRSKPNPVFGNLYASNDRGKTWRWLEPELLNRQCEGYTGILSNGRQVIIADKTGAHAFVSDDAGDTWTGPHPTGTTRVTMSLVNGEFWLLGKTSRASADGRTWRALPDGIPGGQIAASPAGTLVSIDRKRYDIQRSTDGGKSWSKVHEFAPETEHVHGAQGLRDIAFGYVTP